MKDILILGVGNYIMGDDGFGIHVVNYLNSLSIPENVEVVDGGTKGVELLHYFENKKSVIIVDVIDLGKEPGEIIEFSNNEVQKYFNIKFSGHELGVTDLLIDAELIDILPENIVIIGCQPEKIDITTELSENLKSKIPIVAKRILELIQNTDIK